MRGDFLECREVATVSRQTPSELSGPLYRGKLGAVRRQKQQAQMVGVLTQEGPQQDSVMMAGVFGHHKLN